MSRYVRPDKCTAIMNYPDTSIFSTRLKKRRDGKFVIVYPGTLNWHQGLDIAVKAFSLIKDQASGVEFHIYGEGSTKAELAGSIAEYGLNNRVFLGEPVPIAQIAEVMANADLGIIPKRNDGFGGEAFSTKSLEFMTLGVPIIMSKTKIDQHYFDESIVKFFDPDDEKALADAMLLLIRNNDLREKLAQNALNFAGENSWEVKKDIYLKLVDSLIDKFKK